MFYSILFMFLHSMPFWAAESATGRSRTNPQGYLPAPVMERRQSIALATRNGSMNGLRR